MDEPGNEYMCSKNILFCKDEEIFSGLLIRLAPERAIKSLYNITDKMYSAKYVMLNFFVGLKVLQLLKKQPSVLRQLA